MRFSMLPLLIGFGWLTSHPLMTQASPPRQDEAAKATAAETEEAQFSEPVRLRVKGKPIRLEAPGYAAPCWADIDGDGKQELLVGQFSRGKIRVFRDLGDDGFASAEWLKAGDDTAQVPGIW